MFCRQIGGKLVEPRTNDVTGDMKRFFDYYEIDEYYWIGLTDLVEEGQYRWSSDFTNLTGYTHWYQGQPINNRDKNCVVAD